MKKNSPVNFVVKFVFGSNERKSFEVCFSSPTVFFTVSLSSHLRCDKIEGKRLKSLSSDFDSLKVCLCAHLASVEQEVIQFF